MIDYGLIFDGIIIATKVCIGMLILGFVLLIIYSIFWRD